MPKYYYRIYDQTTWVVKRHHEVETSWGCYKGAITLLNLEEWNWHLGERFWTVIDSVWFELQKYEQVIEVSRDAADELARMNHRCEFHKGK